MRSRCGYLPVRNEVDTSTARTNRQAVGLGVTRPSGTPAPAGQSIDVLARDRTTAPCLPPPASRAPAAPCAGWLRARLTAPSSTTTRRRRGRRALMHAALQPEVPARRPHVH